MKSATLPILIVSALSGCAPLSDDIAGNVVSFTDTMVVIEAYGGFHSDDYKKPPSAMQENAQSLCQSRGRDAKFLNASLKDTGSKTIIGPLGTSYVSGQESFAPVQYRFACI